MVRPAKPNQKLPFPFVVEALAPLEPEVRRMFSGFAVYVGDRVVLMLRDHVKSPQDNGLWLVLAEGIRPEDRKLLKELPSLRRIEMLGHKIGHWLLIPSAGPHFESEATKVCDLLLRHDARIGQVPRSRRR